MIDTRKGGGGYRRSPGGGSMNKKIPCGGGGSFPYGVWGYFFMWEVFSLHVRAWRPCLFFPCGGGGGGALLGLPPHNNFCGSLLSQIFIIFPDRGGLNLFLRELFDPPKRLAPAPAPIKINNLCPPHPP